MAADKEVSIAVSSSLRSRGAWTGGVRLEADLIAQVGWAVCKGKRQGSEEKPGGGEADGSDGSDVSLGPGKDLFRHSRDGRQGAAVGGAALQALRRRTCRRAP
ncbi:hypothetical protein GCM10023080_057740 [Streptomyces pseudoechinosporeus]